MTDIEHLKKPLSEETKGSTTRKKSGPAKSVRKLEEKIRELTEQIERNRDVALRRLADMDNLLKSKDREMANTVKMANHNAVMAMLPFLDSLESAIQANPEDKNIVTLRNQFVKIMKELGLTRIEAKGKRYDPFEHEVVALGDDGEEGAVIEEIQAGYKLNNEVIRTSKVIVSKRGDKK
ncbi:MAG: nucleotide exchange factor GrpE [Candidatus Thermoplasmatota archaeon]|nr:nucleotide exchange factor GrpE [Candidatus Thermoplasmatota archaeon]